MIRVLVCELNRITSHLVGLATTGLEMGAVSIMLYGLREREMIMDIFEGLTGLRMNHAYIRIGGVVMDLPEDGPRKIRDLIDILPEPDRRVRDAARTTTRSGASATKGVACCRPSDASRSA